MATWGSEAEMKTLTEKKSFQFLPEGSGVAGSMLL